jgi:small-conductance mechanosensitive channel
MWGFISILLLSAVTAVLWLSYGFAAAYKMFNLSMVPPVIHAAAAVSTAVLIVIVVAQLLLRVGFARLLRTDPTGLQRGLVFGALSFTAAAAVLAHLGFDLTTILTTSAIVTAIVGFSIQPTLGSAVSGLAVDRIVRVGDGVLLNGEDIEITSLNWRSAAGRRHDGGMVILPNAQLANTTLIIFPRDRPARAQVALEVPASVPPDRVRALINAIVDDFPEVDARRPVVLELETSGTGNSVAGYRAAFWVRHYAQRSQVEADVLSRIWYVFRREKIAPSGDPQEAHGDAELLPTLTAALHEAAAQRPVLIGLGNKAKEALQLGEILRYGDGERVVLPTRLAGRSCLLIDGSIAQIDSASDTPMRAHPRREASLVLIEQSLALHIGPYAEVAVHRAAANGASLPEICDTVAQEIDDPDARQAFVRNIDVPRDVILGPGFLFQAAEARREGGDESQLRAVGHALILAAPDGLLSADDAERETSAGG